MLSPQWGATPMKAKRCGRCAARQIIFLQCRSTNVQPEINGRSAIAFATIGGKENSSN
jgi:hypothetical protein